MVFDIKENVIDNNITDDSRDSNLSILLLNLFFIFKIIKGLLSMLFVMVILSLITINMVLNFMIYYRWTNTDDTLSMDYADNNVMLIPSLITSDGINDEIFSR